MRRTISVALMLGLTLVAAGARAETVVLDFGDGELDAPPTYAPPYTEDGFAFSTINQPQPGVEQDHVDIVDKANYPNAGERELSIHTGNDGDEVIIDLLGASFSVVSLVVEEWQDPSTGIWEAFASNGAQLTFTSLGTVLFDSTFSNITSLTLRSTSVPDLNDFTGYLTVDDITMQVPEPSAAALALAAFGGLYLRSRLRTDPKRAR